MFYSKWCVLAKSSGSHSFCVCMIHQNVVLLLQASNTEKTYKELIQYLVCCINNKNYMLRHCEKCPVKENLKFL